MRAVNLLPRETRSKSVGAEKLPALVAAGVGVVVVAALSGGYLMESSKVAQAQRGLDAAKVQLAATPLPPALPKVETEPAAITGARQPRLQAVAEALGQRIAWDRVLREFSLVLPTDVWLSSLTLTAPIPSTAGVAAGTGLQMSGTTYSYDSVARLLARLSMIPDLTNVTLATAVHTGNLVTFGVSASVKGAPAPPAPAAVAPATTTTTSGASS